MNIPGVYHVFLLWLVMFTDFQTLPENIWIGLVESICYSFIIPSLSQHTHTLAHTLMAALEQLSL